MALDKCLYLVQDRDKRWALLNMAMKIWVSQHAENSLNS